MRGGICVGFGVGGTAQRQPAFDGLLTLFSTESGLLTGIESFWDHGGVPLHDIQRTRAEPQGVHPVLGGTVRVGSLAFRQSETHLEFWFGSDDDAPEKPPSRRHESGIPLFVAHERAERAGWPVPVAVGADAWRLVVGLVIELPRAAVVVPVTSLELSPEDFK